MVDHLIMQKALRENNLKYFQEKGSPKTMHLYLHLTQERDIVELYVNNDELSYGKLRNIIKKCIEAKNKPICDYFGETRNDIKDILPNLVTLDNIEFIMQTKMDISKLFEFIAKHELFHLLRESDFKQLFNLHYRKYWFHPFGFTREMAEFYSRKQCNKQISQYFTLIVKRKVKIGNMDLVDPLWFCGYTKVTIIVDQKMDMDYFAEHISRFRNVGQILLHFVVNCNNDLSQEEVNSFPANIELVNPWFLYNQIECSLPISWDITIENFPQPPEFIMEKYPTLQVFDVEIKSLAKHFKKMKLAAKAGNWDSLKALTDRLYSHELSKKDAVSLRSSAMGNKLFYLPLIANPYASHALKITKLNEVAKEFLKIIDYDKIGEYLHFMLFKSNIRKFILKQNDKLYEKNKRIYYQL